MTKMSKNQAFNRGNLITIHRFMTIPDYDDNNSGVELDSYRNGIFVKYLRDIDAMDAKNYQGSHETYCLVVASHDEFDDEQLAIVNEQDIRHARPEGFSQK